MRRKLARAQVVDEDRILRVAAILRPAPWWQRRKIIEIALEILGDRAIVLEAKPREKS